MKKMNSRSAILFAISLMLAKAVDAGIWDPGLINGRWRTDYDNPVAGTQLAPLSSSPTPLWPSVPFAVPFVPQDAVFPFSFSRGFFGAPNEPFWVISANTEAVFLKSLGDPLGLGLPRFCNAGPPNQTQYVFDDPTDSEIYALNVRPYHEINKPHKNRVLLSQRVSGIRNSACQSAAQVPYLSYGVHAGRGSPSPALAYIQQGTRATEPVLEAGIKILNDSGVPGQYAGVQIVANWQGKPRMIQINLWERLKNDGTPENIAPVNLKWNWNIQESFWYPGAEIVYTDAQDLRTRLENQDPSNPCRAYRDDIVLPNSGYAWSGWTQGTGRQRIRINLNSLFKCVGGVFDDFNQQTGPIAITGIHFFIESGARAITPTYLETRQKPAVAIDGIDLYPESAHVYSSNETYVSQLYRDFLGREGATGDVAYLASQLSRNEVDAPDRAQLAVSQFLRSAELAGSSAKITRAYLVAFGRIPEAAGQRFWTEQLKSGRQSLREIADQFVGSGEFFTRYNINGQLPDNEQFVRILHRNTFGSEPSAEALTYWKGTLDRGQTSRGEVMLHFSEHESYVQLVQAKVEVILLFVSMFGFAPDEGGLAWTNYPRENLVQAILYNPIYRQRFLPSGW
jgi:hypothetical protein